MHLHHFSLLGLSLASLALGIHIRPYIFPSPALPNSAALPPSTHATLTALSQSYSVPLQTLSDFDFTNVTTGSYLMDIYCHTHFFAPLRVDVQQDKELDESEVHVWSTFRGNDWDNKGEAVQVNTKMEGRKKIHSFIVTALSKKEYLSERPGFSPLSLLQNPMILIAALTMGLVFGMPYLMENLDPEFKSEFEERQRSSGANPATANPLQNFDAAAWLAGPKPDASKKLEPVPEKSLR